MQRLKAKLFKQYTISPLVGGVKDLAQRTMFYVSAINFVLLIITTFSVSQLVNQIGLFVFVGIIIVVLLLAMAIEYKFILPSSWVFINKQRYKHGEPLIKDIQEVLKVQKKMIKRLRAIEKKLSISEGTGDDSVS